MAFFKTKKQEESEQIYGYETQKTEIGTVTKSNKDICKLVIKELKNMESDIEYREYATYYEFYLYEDELEFFNSLYTECEKDFFNKASINSIVSSAESRNTSNLNDEIIKSKPKIKSAIVSFEIKNEMEKRLMEEGVWFEFVNENGKLYIDFYEEDEEKINNIATEAVANYTNFISAREAEKEAEKEYQEKIKQTKEIKKQPKNNIKEQEEKQNVGRKRKHQMIIRMDDEERKIIENKIKMSGKTKSSYGREMMMHGQVKVAPSAAEDVYLLEEIENIASVLGKTSGAIVKIMQIGKQNNCFTEEQINDFQREINSLRAVKREINKKIKSVWNK